MLNQSVSRDCTKYIGATSWTYAKTVYLLCSIWFGKAQLIRGGPNDRSVFLMQLVVVQVLNTTEDCDCARDIRHAVEPWSWIFPQRMHPLSINSWPYDGH